MITLHVTPAQEEPFDYRVERDSLVIGRSMKSDLSVADRFLSRQHARLYRQDESWMIEDLGSRNGTFVNGIRVSGAAAVKPGDVITMSASVIKVFDHHQPPPDQRQEIIGESSVLRPATELLALSTVMPQPEQDPAGETVRLQAERLNILNEVHQALAESIALDELLDLILARTFDCLRPQQGAIYLRDAAGELYPAASRPVSEQGGDPSLSESLTREVVDKGMAALVHDVRVDERFAAAQSLLESGVRSLVAAPLAHSTGTLGMIVLSSSADLRVFTEDDMKLLTSLASVAALRIRYLALAEEAAERRRLQEEVALARQIQLALIPDELPVVAGYEIFGGNTPSQGVSGDYYEVIERRDGSECVLFIADVSGKGIAASLLTAYIEALSSAPIEDGLEAHEVCTRVSRRLYRRTPHERFAAAFLVVLEPATGSLRYCNAGHNAALLLRAGGEVERLRSTGVPLGVLPDFEYAVAAVDLNPGDLLVMYTDGISEALDPEDEEYGEDRLEQVCSRLSEKPLEELAAAIEADTERFAAGVPFADDRTLVMLRRC